MKVEEKEENKMEGDIDHLQVEAEEENTVGEEKEEVVVVHLKVGAEGEEENKVEGDEGVHLKVKEEEEEGNLIGKVQIKEEEGDNIIIKGILDINN